jgi:hypothetical protein
VTLDGYEIGLDLATGPDYVAVYDPSTGESYFGDGARAFLASLDSAVFNLDQWRGKPLPKRDLGDDSPMVADSPRCPICDWPMVEDAKDGCVPGNCAYRPPAGSNECRRIQARRRTLGL